MSNKNIIKVTNTNGTSGEIEISDGMSFDLKPPKLSNPSEMLSPKHLIGMAWSTCLNATIESILTSNKKDNKSRVRVEVESKRTDDYGLHYIVTAFVAVENYDENETLKIANTADRLCPISKLITNNPFVSLTFEEY